MPKNEPPLLKYRDGHSLAPRHFWTVLDNVDRDVSDPLSLSIRLLLCHASKQVCEFRARIMADPFHLLRNLLSPYRNFDTLLDDTVHVKLPSLSHKLRYVLL